MASAPGATDVRHRLAALRAPTGGVVWTNRCFVGAYFRFLLDEDESFFGRSTRVDPRPPREVPPRCASAFPPLPPAFPPSLVVALGGGEMTEDLSSESDVEAGGRVGVADWSPEGGSGLRSWLAYRAASIGR